MKEEKKIQIYGLVEKDGEASDGYAMDEFSFKGWKELMSRYERTVLTNYTTYDKDMEE